MARLSPAQALAPTFATWKQKDLQELSAIVNALLESQDQATEPPSEVPVSKPRGRPSKGGYVELKYIPRNGKRYGPYRYLRYYLNGIRKSVYLGNPLNVME
ncbi:MAG TPA: hypothetical protein VIJ25_02525 [Methylococcales bacterium]|jgi:hypothetical protein